MIKTQLITLTVILIASLTACKTHRPAPVKADYSISIHEEFQLEMESNATTGYSWKWMNHKAESIVDSIGFSYTVNYPDLMGSPGKEIWKFRAIQIGTDTLHFVYRRPWDKNAIARTKDVVVEVK